MTLSTREQLKRSVESRIVDGAAKDGHFAISLPGGKVLAHLLERQPLSEAVRNELTGCGTHTLRRTRASLIYRRTQLLLGHSILESTARCLGIEVDDALEMAEQTEV